MRPKASRVLARWSIAACACAAALTLAACGSSSPSTTSSGSGAGGLITVKVADIEGVTAEQFMSVAQQLGFFKAHGLNVEVTSSTANQTFYPALLSGKYDIVASTQTDFLTAVASGYPLMALPDAWEDAPDLVVPKSITTVAGLSGKTIGVPSLSGLQYSMVTYALKKLGVKNYHLSIVPFVDQPAELAAGKIQVADVDDPFESEILENPDYHVLINPTKISSGSNAGLAGWFTTSSSYAAANPNVIKDWDAAVAEAMDWVPEHTAQFRQIAAKALQLSPTIEARFIIAPYLTNFSAADLQPYIKPLVEGGVLSSANNLDLPKHFIDN